MPPKISKMKNELINLRMMLRAMGGKAEPYCNVYVRPMPYVEFLFVRNKKRSRYPKYETMIMRHGGFTAETTETEKEFKHEMKFHNLWGAN